MNEENINDEIINTPPEGKKAPFRFSKNRIIKTITTSLSSAIAMALFFLAVASSKLPEDNTSIFENVASELASPMVGFNSVIITVMLCLFGLISLAILITQFKSEYFIIFFSAMQMPLIVASLILTSALRAMTSASVVCYVLSALFTVGIMILGVIFFIKSDKSDVRIEGKRVSLILLILTLLSQGSAFFIPFLYMEQGGVGIFETMSNVFYAEKFTMLSSVMFVVFFMLYLGTLIYAFNQIKYLFKEGGDFNRKLRGLIFFSIIINFAFFAVGLALTFYYRAGDAYQNPSTTAYVPFLISSAILLSDAILNGKYREAKEKKTAVKKSNPRTIMLIFIILFSVLAIVTLFSNILIATFENPYLSEIRINGFDVMRNYDIYGKSYQSVAFLLYSMVILASLGLLIGVVSFLRDSKSYKAVFLSVIIFDFLAIASIAAFAEYYQIVQQANIERLESLLTAYGINVNEKCTVTTDALYYFLGATLLLIVTFFCKPYTNLILEENDEKRIIAELSNIGNNKPAAPMSRPVANTLSRPEEAAQAPVSAPTPKPVEAPHRTFAPDNTAANDPLNAGMNAKGNICIDQCPPFTFIDGQEYVYQALLAERKSVAFEEISLRSLVRYIVEYAKNSRLHLSYTFEDVATFIAGLGISRLSILQGMSGTGKTSLPKIFAEAIFGVCDIVEVESSWKDKNELLGYYNEFSKIYTPKKFTQDLYKAKANPEVVTLIVLDEMNLSRIEYYFSDFLSLMENEEDKRQIKLVNIKIANYESGERVSYKNLEDDMVLKIPANVWFIGTANRDESTFEISDKVYDRANTMNFNKRAKKITEFGEPMSPRFLNANVLRGLLKNACETHSFDISKYARIAKAEEILSRYNLSFGNRIERQMENFVKIYSACFEGEDVVNEAVEKIYLSKVVAKLEFKTVENKDELAMQFAEIGFTKCAEFIRKLNEDF